MTEQDTLLDDALERVIAAARAHLQAVRAAGSEADDEAVWNAYVELNNASREYDELLNDVYGEVTPWDVEPIPAETPPPAPAAEAKEAPQDPYPHVISVRQRRDYRVPSVAALLRAAEDARLPAAEGEEVRPISTVGEAIVELLQAGDGSLAMLDVPELDPLDGVVVVAEVAKPLNADAHPEADGESPFRLAAEDRTLARLDEHPYAEPDD